MCRQMLFPRLILLSMFVVVDVQTTEPDVITSIVQVSLMLLPIIAVCGRCYTTLFVAAVGVG